MDGTDTCITVGLRPDFSSYDVVFPIMPSGLSWNGSVHRSLFPTGPAASADWPPANYQRLLYWLARETDLLPARHDHLPWYLAMPRQRASMAALNRYIRTRLFDGAFDPGGDRWRLLLHPGVLARIARAFDTRTSPDGPGELRSLSTVASLRVPRAYALAVDKCIYTHVTMDSGVQAHDRMLVAWAQVDPAVQAFCRISPCHDFVRLPCIDGAANAMRPDFLVRMAAVTYLVDTDAARERSETRQRRRTAVAWCMGTNALPAAQRGGSHWYYAPLHELDLTQWRRRTRYLGDVLAAAQWQAHYRARVRG